MAENKKTRHGRPYLFEVDLMRVIFIFGVLLNHTTTAFSMAMADSVSKNFLHATHLSLHFTRMGFMFMTGLVLFLNYYNREHHWGTFWKKRYKSTGIPYLAWNAILLVATSLITGTALNGQKFWSDFVYGVTHGSNFYLYYVFVIFQLYLIFPLIVALFKRFPKNHEFMMLVSILAQLMLLIAIKYWLPHVNTDSWWYIFRSYGMNILVYQVYFMAGAYAAIHYQKVTSFIMTHAKAIEISAGILALGTVGLYYGNTYLLKLPYSSIQIVHQPYIMIYALVMVAFVFYLGKRYAYKRTHGLNPLIEKFVATGSKVSFGIYLSQTIPILILDNWLAKLSFIPTWAMLLALPLGYIFVVGCSFLIAYFCYKVPPFGFLIGRPNWCRKPVSKTVSKVKRQSEKVINLNETK
ncbi:putative acyltransferase [Pediococcus damnosus]|uniref:acyltransferase n=2 Tax=Pediococcus damnosus TaxID=51663 RepID=UPI00078B615F|nr:acyltransferase [Pediococcus damnosus]AMV61067.1 putative acyltransferase [Pediococcus damnosus]AMV65427.1 putative acyltransferase [Pediococcus damnosus]